MPPEVSAYAQDTAQDSDIPVSYHSYLQSTTFGIKRGEAVTDATEFKHNGEACMYT